MGQSTSVSLAAHVDQTTCVTKVVYHADAGEVSTAPRAQQQKRQVPTRVVTQVEQSAPRVLVSCTSPDASSAATIPQERMAAPEPVMPPSSVKCRKCIITGVDPDKYCLHVTAKTAESIEHPEFNVASLPRAKVPALIWYMLSNLGIIRRFKISRHSILNLVNGIDHVYTELDMSSEWLKSLELAHGMYVILRRRKENSIALDELFNCAKWGPASIGAGVDRLQGMSLIFSALVVFLDDVPRPTKFKAEKLIGSEFLPRKGLPWRVIQKTGKDIFLRLTTVEEQRLEALLTGVVRVLNDPMSLEEYGELCAAQVHKPKIGEELPRSSFVVPTTPSWNSTGAPDSPAPRRPQGGDMHDTCEYMAVTTKAFNDSAKPQPVLGPMRIDQNSFTIAA